MSSTTSFSVPRNTIARLRSGRLVMVDSGEGKGARAEASTNSRVALDGRRRGAVAAGGEQSATQRELWLMWMVWVVTGCCGEREVQQQTTSLGGGAPLAVRRVVAVRATDISSSRGTLTADWHRAPFHCALCLSPTASTKTAWTLLDGSASTTTRQILTATTREQIRTALNRWRTGRRRHSTRTDFSSLHSACTVHLHSASHRTTRTDTLSGSSVLLPIVVFSPRCPLPSAIWPSCTRARGRWP